MSSSTSSCSSSSSSQSRGFHLPEMPPQFQTVLQHAADLRSQGEKSLGEIRGAVTGQLRALQMEVNSLRSEVSKAVCHLAGDLQQRHHDLQQRSLHMNPSSVHAFASLSLCSPGITGKAPQPVAELAMHPGEVAARLRGVTVYTVVNKKNEFVLVSGEGTQEPKQLGLFFFSESDASSLVSKILEQDPKLGRQARVLPVGMDQVYKFAISPRQKGLEGATFRFMPDMEQIKNAVELYRNAGLEVDSFVGVPVFQAEGLNVKTEKAKYTPLFLSKADLDNAIGGASQDREAKVTQAASQKYEKAAEEARKVKEEMEAAEDDKIKRRLEAKHSKAEARASKALAKLNELKNKSKPKVEVGSLEEVIVNMENDQKGHWGDVMFIPAGALTEPIGNEA